MKVFYISAVCGDGSSRTDFFDSRECIVYCRDVDNGLEEYWDGDGGSWGSFEVPGGTPITGITIRSFKQLKGEEI